MFYVDLVDQNTSVFWVKVKFTISYLVNKS